MHIDYPPASDRFYFRHGRGTLYVRDVTVVGKSAAEAQLDGAPPTQGRATQIPSSCTLREFLVARDPAENRRPAGHPGIATDTAKAFTIDEPVADRPRDLRVIIGWTAQSS
jgi:hypothetical protein